MFKKRVQKFSIRKLSIGAASVLLGTFFVGISNGNVDAATINNDGVEIQDKENNYEPTATVDKTEGDDTSSEPETRTHNGAIIETDDDTYIPEAVRKAHDSNPGAIIVANGNGEVTAEDNFDGGSIKPVLPSDTQDEESNYEPAASVDKTEGDDTSSEPETRTHNGAIIETDDDTYIPEAVRKAHDSNPGAIIVANGNGEVTAEDNFDGGSIKPVLPSDTQDEESNYEPAASVDKTEGDDMSSEPETRTHNGAIIETDDDTYIPEAVRKAHDSNPGAIIVANGNGEVTAEDNFDGGSIKPVLPSDTQDEESNYEPTAGSRQKTNVDETNSSEKTKLEENTQAQATISTNNVNSNLHKSNNYPDHLLTKVNKLQAKLAKENNSQNVVSLSTKSEEKLPQTSINKAETVILTTFGFIISIFGLADIRRKKN